MVSTTAFNAWPVGLVMVVPVTSFAMPEYLRSIAQRRLRRHLGTAEAATLTAVDDWLRRLTGL